MQNIELGSNVVPESTLPLLWRFFYMAMLDIQLLSHNQNLPIVDLHEFSNVTEALEFLESRLFYFYKKREQHVRVIHGVGEGILKQKVHDALKQNALVKRFGLEDHGGSTIVVLNII